MGGGTRQKPCIWFSGFWSQGDGACFEGRYAYAPRASLRIRDYAPRDTELHRIADALQALQRLNFYQLTASFRRLAGTPRLCDDVRRRPRQPCRPGDRRAHRGRPGRPRCAISPTGSIARSSANTSFRPQTKPSTRAVGQWLHLHRRRPAVRLNAFRND